MSASPKAASPKKDGAKESGKKVVETTPAATESERRKARMERFGSAGVSATGSLSGLSSEEQDMKRKRAERFGGDDGTSGFVPDSAKRQRLQRFGGSGGMPTTTFETPVYKLGEGGGAANGTPSAPAPAGSGTGQSEADKRAKRAARFAAK